jgi:hypothetical protein
MRMPEDDLGTARARAAYFRDKEMAVVKKMLADLVNTAHEEMKRLEWIQEEHRRDLSDGGGLNDYGRGCLATWRQVWAILTKDEPAASGKKGEG